MSKTQITLQSFMSLQNSKGEFKTWGDMKDGGYLGNLKNNEVLGSVFKAPVEIVGENIWYEYKIFPQGKEWDNGTTGVGKPVLNRVMFNLPEKRLQFNYTLDLFGEKEAKDWSFYIGQEDSNIWTQISNQNNVVAIQAIYDYCLATGQFKVLTKLGKAGQTNQDYFDETANIVDIANGIMSTQTSVNLGLDPERLSIMVSPTVMRQITTGISATNVSQGAFDSIKLGRINNLFGYNWDRSIYLGQKGEIIKDKGWDFTKLLGIVYNLDSLAFFQQTPKTTNTPVNQGEIVRAFGWKPFAAMLPSQEHTSYILLSEMPTYEEINAARAKLLTAQPNVYAKLPGAKGNQLEGNNSNSSEYNTMKKNASNFGTMVAPNVEIKP